MFLYTKNKKPERLYVFENGLLVGKSGENMYNQVKGNTINGYFKDGVIDFMRAKGSAESVYYIKDDSMALVGVNRVNKADVIDLIRLFYDAMGGAKHYPRQPREVKALCKGLKRSLILKKFKSAGQLRRYLETMKWS